MSARTRLARAVYWISGQLSRIKTPQRFHEVVSTDPFVTRPDGERTWSMCSLSLRVLGLSERLDPAHWDHWALEHRECDPRPCAECGGCACDLAGLDAGSGR